MKKAILFLLTFAIIFAMIPAVGISAADEDDPVVTEALPIASAAEFAAIDPNGDYYLTADITIDTTYAGTFLGVLDGKGFSVTTSVPLFAEINATVSNLTIKGSITTAELQYVGALAGKVLGGTYTKITNEANIENTANVTSGYACAGGLFGYLTVDNLVTVVECSNKGTIHSVECAAGIIADTAKGAKAAFTKCSNTGNITGDTNSTGGIFGLCESNKENKAELSFTDCTNTGTIKSGSDSAGGICAYGQGWATMSFTNCTNTGNVSSDSNKYNSGGILGDGDGVISFTNCINTGDVSHGESHAGGIVGEITDSGTFKNCYNSGNITGAKMASGIAGGVNLPYFEFCGNTGKITAGSDTASGILSYSKPDDTSAFLYCYNTGDISGKDCVTGIGGYFNGTSGVKFIGCYNTGKLTVLDGNYKTCAIYYSNYSSDLAEGNVMGCYYLEGTAEYDSHFKPDSDSYAAIDAAKTVTAADVASDKLAQLINTAVGKNVYEIRNGQTAPVCDHKFTAIENYEAVAPTCSAAGKTAGYKCPGCSEIIGCEEVAALAHTYENGKCTACGVADPSYKPDVPTGDTSYIFALVALISVLGVAVVAKKRER